MRGRTWPTRGEVSEHPHGLEAAMILQGTTFGPVFSPE